MISTNNSPLSLAVTSTSTGYELIPRFSFQCTSINLSVFLITFGQFLLWTEIPCPLVIYPTMSSPGIGEQQFAKVTCKSALLSTKIGDLVLILFDLFTNLNLALFYLIFKNSIIPAGVGL